MMKFSKVSAAAPVSMPFARAIWLPVRWLVVAGCCELCCVAATGWTCGANWGWGRIGCAVGAMGSECVGAMGAAPVCAPAAWEAAVGCAAGVWAGACWALCVAICCMNAEEPGSTSISITYSVSNKSRNACSICERKRFSIWPLMKSVSTVASRKPTLDACGCMRPKNASTCAGFTVPYDLTFSITACQVS